MQIPERTNNESMLDQSNIVQAARERIWQKVRWMENHADGVLHEQRSGMHRILVIKEGSEIRLHFANLSNRSESNGMSGRMSELDLKDPLFPFAPYTQGMMLTLLWTDSPRRVYTIGFGAGRVPSILHAHIPDLVLESTEIDEDVLPIAQKFFGYIPDDRQKVFIQDGREYLANRPKDVLYDFIHVDAFRGFGHIPYDLGTTEFYDLCKAHLVQGGVVCANLVASDPLFRARVNTMAASFQHAYLFVYDDATVLYGTDAPRLDDEEWLHRGQTIESRYLFSFFFAELATKLKHVDESAAYLQRFPHEDVVLHDKNPPVELNAISKTDPLFHKVGRNQLCPCGSGKKFKRCHGR
jgi:spermidine synthase